MGDDIATALDEIHSLEAEKAAVSARIAFIDNSKNGDIDKENALKNLKTETLCDQILFHTEKSLAYLKFIDVEVG